MHVLLNIIVICVTVSQLNGFPTLKVDKSRPEENPNLFEGDIILPKRSTSVRGVLRRGNSVAWTNGIIPYEISSGFEPQERAFLVDIMQKMESEIAINNVKCIQFRQRIPSDPYYIVIKEALEGCSSTVGQNTGVDMERTVALDKDICFSQPLIMHELLHVLGFYHEQSRPDRDDYIEIFYENIEPDMIGNFAKYDHTYLDTQNTPYDYDSLLHYNGYAFSSNGEPTILPRDPNVILQRHFDMSPIDIEEVRLFYKCSASGVTLPNIISPVRINQTISSSLTEDSLTFDRRGSNDDLFYYEAYEVYASVEGYYKFASRASIDTYGHFYKKEFDVYNVYENLMEIDDDGSGYPDFQLEAFLETDTKYILVVTTQKPLVTGDYQVIVLNSPSVEIKKLNNIPISTTASPNIISKYSSALTTDSLQFIPHHESETHYYEAIIVTVSHQGTYTFESVSDFDSYGYFYEAMFDPSNSNVDIVEEDDDSAGDGQFSFYDHMSHNQKYILVVTTFDKDEIGAFSITANGPGIVTFSRMNQ